MQVKWLIIYESKIMTNIVIGIDFSIINKFTELLISNADKFTAALNSARDSQNAKQIKYDSFLAHFCMTHVYV